MKNILVPCDFSKEAINAYQVALDLAALSKGTVYLVNIIEFPAIPNTLVTPVRVMANSLIKEMREKGIRHFEKIIATHNKKNIKVHPAVEFGVPAPLILKFVKDHSIDLIVLGSHGTRMTSVFVGNTTERIIRTSPVPVIAVKEYVKRTIKKIVLPFAPELLHQRVFMEKVKTLQKFLGATLEITHINTPFNFTPDHITNSQIKSFVSRYKLLKIKVSIVNDMSTDTGILRFAESNNIDLIAMGTHGRKGLAHLIAGSHTEDVALQGKRLIWTSLLNVSK